MPPAVFPDNRFTPCTILAIDAVGHSRLVRHLALKASHALFAQVEARVRTEVEAPDVVCPGIRGQLLGWAGDGGIAAFTGHDPKDDVTRALRALRVADNILAVLPAINGQHSLHGDEALQLRLALHAGAIIWQKDPGSIHSQDVNFVAHLEHALPEDIVGLSDDFYRSLPAAEKDNCLLVGDLEEHEVYVYARDVDRRLSAKRRFERKQLRTRMGALCLADGLIDFEFRDAGPHKLPNAGIYSQVQEELLMAGVTLASSFKQQTANPTLTALRAANARGVAFRLLVLDPDHAGAPYLKSVDSLSDTLDSLRADVTAGYLRPGSIEVRGLKDWPHFTGIMIDGNVAGPARGDLRGSVKSVETLLIRVQFTIPPEDDKAQHFAPVFQYGGGGVSDTMYTFIRGFRHYWQAGRSILSL